jgi:hypothetical protein
LNFSLSLPQNFSVKNKKWLLLLIIAFPSFFWLILETSTINSRRLPYYGPKIVKGKGDTTFYQVQDSFNLAPASNGQIKKLSKQDFPLYAIVFVNPKYRADAYRLTGLSEYLNYKKEKVQHIPFIIVTPDSSGISKPYEELKKLTENENVHFYTWPSKDFDKITRNYFAAKPYYIDYSFFMLVDGKRHIRGYYDGRYVSELKRLIEEYQHLRLKEEKQNLINENEIKSEN